MTTWTYTAVFLTPIPPDRSGLRGVARRNECLRGGRVGGVQHYSARERMVDDVSAPQYRRTLPGRVSGAGGKRKRN